MPVPDRVQTITRVDHFKPTLQQLFENEPVPVDKINTCVESIDGSGRDYVQDLVHLDYIGVCFSDGVYLKEKGLKAIGTDREPISPNPTPKSVPKFRCNHPLKAREETDDAQLCQYCGTCFSSHKSTDSCKRYL